MGNGKEGRSEEGREEGKKEGNKIQKETSREGEMGIKAGVNQSSPEELNPRASLGVLRDVWCPGPQESLRVPENFISIAASSDSQGQRKYKVTEMDFAISPGRCKLIKTAQGLVRGTGDSEGTARNSEGSPRSQAKGLPGLGTSWSSRGWNWKLLWTNDTVLSFLSPCLNGKAWNCMVGLSDRFVL